MIAGAGDSAGNGNQGNTLGNMIAGAGDAAGNGNKDNGRLTFTNIDVGKC